MADVKCVCGERGGREGFLSSRCYCFVMFCACSVCLQDQSNDSVSYLSNRRAWENTNIGLLKMHRAICYVLAQLSVQSVGNATAGAIVLLPPDLLLDLAPYPFLFLYVKGYRIALPYPFYFFYTNLPPLNLTFPIYCTIDLLPTFFRLIPPITLKLSAWPAHLSLGLQLAFLSHWCPLVHPLGILHLPLGHVQVVQGRPWEGSLG